MAEAKLISVKRLKINKANQTIVAIIAVCAFIFIFSIVAIKSLTSQYFYQNRVTSARQATVNRLASDTQAANNLINSYNTFVGQTTNIIGGSSTGSSNQDGSNAKIILDALPDTYDFPALVTSVENLINSEGVTTMSITGTDTGGSSSTVSPSTTASSSTIANSSTKSSQPTPIAIPFTFTIQGSYSAVQGVISNLQRSIRPIQIQTIDMTGSDNQLTVSVNATTYYLPVSGLSLTTETVK